MFALSTYIREVLTRRNPPLLFLTRKEGLRYFTGTPTSSGLLDTSCASRSLKCCLRRLIWLRENWGRRPYSLGWLHRSHVDMYMYFKRRAWPLTETSSNSISVINNGWRIRCCSFGDGLRLMLGEHPGHGVNLVWREDSAILAKIVIFLQKYWIAWQVRN